MIGNIGGVNPVNNYSYNDLMKRLAIISSGNKIFNAEDDAAGLAISNLMESQYRGMEQSINNVQNAYSMLNVASGALNDIQDTMNKMQELSVQASNGIYTDQDKQYIQQQYTQLTQHLQDVYNNTEYNGKKLFNNDQMTLQAGPNAGDTQTINIPNLGKEIQQLTKVNITSNPESALQTIQNIQTSVSSAQSTVGSIQNNLNDQANNLMTGYENLVASQSQIVDADMAKELLQATTDKIQNTASIYSVINFKNTTLAYMESLLSG